MSGRTQSYSYSTSIAGHASLLVFLPTISARRDSCGAIPFTTGMRFAQPAIDGRSPGCVSCWLTWMRFAWITSADSPQRGTFQWAHQRLSPDDGCRGRVLALSKRCTKNWATCRLSSKIWVLSLRTCRHCVINFNCQGDRKSTRLNSSHDQISYAVFCLKKQISNQTP